MADIETIAEKLQDEIESAIGESHGGVFVVTQEESVELLRDIATWCRDRAQGIQAEIDGDS